MYPMFSELLAVSAAADQLSRRSSFKRFLHSSSDEEAVNDMKEKIVLAHQRFQVRCSRRFLLDDRGIELVLWHRSKVAWL